MTDQEFNEKYLKAFTPSQAEAVRAVDGPVLLLAVPGSGKTTVLVARLGYMALCRGIEPESILTMTYTVAAAGEMRRRFSELFGPELAGRMEFRTINGVSARIISYYEKNHGRDRAFRLLDSEGELNRIVAQIYCDEAGESYAPPGTVKDIRAGITYVKNMMLSGAEAENVDVGVEAFPRIYARYSAYLKGRRLMDYDDQMKFALLFLEKVPSVLEHFRSRFRYICVDEAQDTSKIQHEIIKLLSSESGNLFMVGDEDQSIYGFRAAYPDALMDFENDHPGAKVLMIEDNFRSTPQIVALANAFVSRNRFRRDKTIRPTRLSGENVRVIRISSRGAQFAYLLQEALSIRAQTAILYRNNDSAIALIDLLEHGGIPYNGRNFDTSFFSHRIVNDIRAIVRFAMDTSDGDAFMLIYYKFGFPLSRSAADYACARARRSGKSILAELLAFPSLPAAAKGRVEALSAVLPEIPGAGAKRALDLIWNDLNYGSYVDENRLDANKLSILRLLAGEDRQIGDLLGRLDELQALIQGHENRPGTLLTLSTIHSAKGLEFERVFLLDIIDGILPARPEEECKRPEDIREYEEERRLYYVAMTRAKSELYLFSCAGFPSGFTDESLAALPGAEVSDADVFSFLNDNLLGRLYASREDGQGVVLAQCGDTFLIEYQSGKRELLSLSQMAARRDPAAKLALPKPRRSEKSDTALRPPLPQGFKAGKRVSHTVFGPGRITALTTSGATTIATITFDRTKEVKRFILHDAVKRGLLKLVN